MQFRAIALAVALACGSSAMANAAARKPVVHKMARKTAVRRSKVAKAHKAKRGKVVRHKVI